MKKFFMLFILCTMLCLGRITAADDVQSSIPSVQSFVQDYPQGWSKDVVYDGCNVLLCSNGEYMLIQLKVMHPAMQMRLLMQGLTFYVDPTGKKREKYSVVFPSAGDVKEQMQTMEPSAGERNPDGVKEMERPDIRPLLYALSSYGVAFDIDGRKEALGEEQFSIDLDEENAVLVYSAIIPLDVLMSTKKLSNRWTLGIYSQGGQQRPDGPGFNDGPGFGGGRPAGGNRMGGERQPSLFGQEDIQKTLIKDINEWIGFNISEIVQ